MQRTAWTLAIPAAALLLAARCSPCAAAESDYDAQWTVAAKSYADKKYDEAASALERLTKSYPERPGPYLWLGRAQCQLGKWSAARDAFTRYADLASTPEAKAEGYREIARTHKKENNFGSAKAFYQKALDVQPGDEASKKELSELEQTAGPATPPSALAPAKSTPAPDAAPASPPPTAPATAPAAPATASEDAGFWHKGIFGVCGGRSAWWGYVIGLILFLPSVLVGPAQVGMAQKNSLRAAGVDPSSAAGIAFVVAALTVGFWYILYWGIPGDAWAWVLMGVSMFVAACTAAGAANAA